jgi:hypothetical protein
MTIETYDIGIDGIGNISVDSDQPNQGDDIDSGTGFWLKARSTNSGVVRFSGVSSDSSGFELAAGDAIQVQVRNLSELYFTGTNSDEICWMKF